jgi:F-type H+-transporting ATPase subunit a
MEGLSLTSQHSYQLLSVFGINHPLLSVNMEIIFHTWIIMGIMISALISARFVLHYSTGIGRFAVVQGAQTFINLCNESLGEFNFAHVTFITTLFLFIAGCNVLSIIPWLEEPTRDLNTTLALGILSFLYIQKTSISTNGFINYIKDYFSPFFLLFPLNIVGKLASIVSVAFRLFGNIFGGSIITTLYFTGLSKSWYLQIFGIVSGLNLLIIGFFTLFEGMLQAFVFTMLTLTYLAMASQKDSH